MALEIDTAAGLRGTSDLRRLVDAVSAATADDEADWIEWKANLDLTEKEGGFSVARNVLGMANRMPERASLTCDGLGYVVVGAAPGNLAGDSVDLASFDQIIEPYLGGVDGPRWTPTYLSVGDKAVLVVTVEPPSPGDAIFILRKEFSPHRSGTVFVRKHARTVHADAADMDALQRRLLAAGTKAAPHSRSRLSATSHSLGSTRRVLVQVSSNG